MGATEQETVRLNLEGNFAAQAAKDANAADRLAASLGGVGAAAGSAGKSSKAFDFVGKLNNAKPVDVAMKPKLDAGGFLGSLKNVVGDVFGPKSAGFLDSVAGKLEQAGPALAGAAGPVGAAAAVLLSAAAAIGIGALKLIHAGVEFGVEQTSIREKVTNAIGSQGYDVAIKVAGDYSIDKDKAFDQVKGLLAAHFAANDVPALIRISAGIGELKGEGKAAAFLEKMEAMANKGGKASEETVKGFAEVGIGADAVYAALAKKLGVSIDAAKQKVKSGAVDMKTALEAVQAAGAAEFGPVADKLGKSVPGLVNKIKIQFAGLFSNFDLGPLKGALETVSKILGGPKGEALGASLSKLGSSVIKALFGPFEGAKGEERLNKFLTGVTGVIEMTAKIVTALAPYIEQAIDTITALFDPDSASNATGLAKAFLAVLDAGTALANLDFAGFMSALWNISFGITQAIAGVVLGFAEAGLNAAQSFADGIGGGLGAVISAAANLGQSAIQAAKSALGIASPSKAFAFIGDMSAQGYAVGANDNDSPAAAGEAMAAKAAGGAAEGAKGAAAGAKGGSGGGVVINLQVTAAPGANGTEMGQQIADVLRRELRSLDREKQERAA